MDIIYDEAVCVMSYLGPGLSECIYQKALHECLRKHGAVSSEVVIPIQFYETTVGFIRADIVFDRKIVIECKAKAHLTASDRIQAKTYVRGEYECTLLNFSSSGKIDIEQIS